MAQNHIKTNIIGLQCVVECFWTPFCMWDHKTVGGVRVMFIGSHPWTLVDPSVILHVDDPNVDQTTLLLSLPNDVEHQHNMRLTPESMHRTIRLYFPACLAQHCSTCNAATWDLH